MHGRRDCLVSKNVTRERARERENMVDIWKC